jgi:hypothetical protein
MSELGTIQGELRLPPGFLHGESMDVIERWLQAHGLVPAAAQSRTWRMDAERPGGYIMSYTFALPPAPKTSVMPESCRLVSL